MPPSAMARVYMSRSYTLKNSVAAAKSTRKIIYSREPGSARRLSVLFITDPSFVFSFPRNTAPRCPRAVVMDIVRDSILYQKPFDFTR